MTIIKTMSIALAGFGLVFAGVAQADTLPGSLPVASYAGPAKLARLTTKNAPVVRKVEGGDAAAQGSSFAGFGGIGLIIALFAAGALTFGIVKISETGSSGS